MVYLLSFWGVNAQIKNVSIVSTNNLSISEQEQLSNLIFMLNGKNNKYANKYDFTFESLLWDDGKVSIKKGFDFTSLLDFKENKKFDSQELEIDEINTLIKSTFLIQFNQNSNLKYDSNNNELNNTSIKEGKLLAVKNCQSCHLLPLSILCAIPPAYAPFGNLP